MRLYLLGGWEQRNAPPAPSVLDAGASGGAFPRGSVGALLQKKGELKMRRRRQVPMLKKRGEHEVRPYKPWRYLAAARG